MKTKIERAAVYAACGMALLELAVSQFSIRMTRLSAVEMTGIALFVFIILGMVTIFAVTRMGDRSGGRLFAVIMNFLAALSAVWYLRMVFGDTVFFRNLLYTLNRQTQVYEPLSPEGTIAALMPLALVMLGAAVYCLAGIGILTASLAAGRGKKREENSGE